MGEVEENFTGRCGIQSASGSVFSNRAIRFELFGAIRPIRYRSSTGLARTARTQYSQQTLGGAPY